ncbi:hypothetical protein DPPLL_01730 [Desulfofustis limnaeus]|uniref:Uncharacterized protein n=1 Tax=Desulfofustis limnaeus TaxID=2740163 RepID=A0ABM7W4F8_9BACT|nr:hypothetical protein DPPLL_01730 [Desulfofustis limnaeus]
MAVIAAEATVARRSKANRRGALLLSARWTQNGLSIHPPRLRENRFPETLVTSNDVD